MIDLEALDTIDRQLLELRILLYSDSLDEPGAAELAAKIDQLYKEYFTE